MSRATALVAVAQQLFISAGVAVGALAIESARWWRGDTELAPSDFSFAFLVIARRIGSGGLHAHAVVSCRRQRGFWSSFGLNAQPKDMFASM